METTNLVHQGQANERLEKATQISAFFLSILLIFAVLAKGAYDWWSLCIVCVGVLGLAMRQAWLSYRYQTPVFLSVFLWSTTLLVPLLLSHTFAKNQWDSTFVVLVWSIAVLVLMVGVHLFRNDTALIWLDAALPVILIAQSIFVVAHRFSGGAWESPATLVNPNFEAGFVLLCLPVLAGRWARSQGAAKDGWALGLVFAGFLLFSSQSVWAWFCVACFLFGQINHWQRRTVFIAVGLALFVMLLTLYFQPYVSTDRFMWWRAALSMFDAFPWTGVGPGNFSSAYLLFKPSLGQNSLYAHSWPLSVLAEMGIIGSLGWMAFFGGWAWTLKNISLGSPRGCYAMGVALFLLFSSVNLGPEMPANLVFLLLFAGLSFSGLNAAVVSLRAFHVILLAALTVGALPFVLSPFLASQYMVNAQRAIEKRNTITAKADLQSAIELQPSWWEPYRLRATIAAAEGNHLEAMEWQQRAIERNRLHWPLLQEMEGYRRLP